jgi:uncharacterized protein YfaS (alpha-2-macroglobulin family)
VSLYSERAIDLTTSKILLTKGSFLDQTVEASLSLSSGPWGSLERARAYLSNYPYGCLEQTVSQAWAFLTAPELSSLSALEKAQIKVGLDTAVKRLATMQVSRGGLAFWPGAEQSFDWGTVYAAHFLTEAKGRTPVPEGFLENILTYLEEIVISQQNPRISTKTLLATKAYALYVLALNGQWNEGWINSLKEREPGLAPSSLIFLAGAEALKSEKPKALMELDSETMDLKYSNLGEIETSFESLPRNEALLLLVWTAVDPLNSRTRELAERVAAAGSKGYWTNTQENGMALWALANYLKKSQRGQSYQVTVENYKGEELGRATEKEISLITGPTLVESLDKPLTVKIEGPGRPYYSSIVSGVPTEPPAPLSSEGLKLIRQVEVEKSRRVSSKSETKLSKDSVVPIDLTVERGDKVNVKLIVSSQTSIQNLVAVDLIPGGLEIVPVEQQLSGRVNNRDKRAEIREDRVIFFLPYLAAGETTELTYQLRAVTEGRFVWPPSSAEAMYEPKKKAIISTGQVIVTNKSNKIETQTATSDVNHPKNDSQLK